MIGFGLPQGWEWIIILVVILLLFGHRLPGMARSLGSGITEFKRGLKDGSKEGAVSKDSSGGSDAGSGNKPSVTDDSNPPKA